jgi:hypothetical protein
VQERPKAETKTQQLRAVPDQPQEAAPTVQSSEPDAAESGVGEAKENPAPAKRAAKPAAQKRTEPPKLLATLLVPVTVRLRPEIASALKRASLERQLNGIATYTQQDIVEEALLPWLQAEGLID